ncbi:unnamed protein product [Cuscuta epithymum]|nr:unnamed protein product [Cuscuta epithymum]
MGAFRSSVFGKYIDVEFIPVPLHLWSIVSRLAKIDIESEAWFVVKGVPVRYSLTEFALISGLTCSALASNYENDFDNDSKARFIEKNFDQDFEGVVSYETVVARFVQLCTTLKDPEAEDELKKDAEVEVIRVAILMFVVMVLLAPSKRKAPIPEWIIGKIGGKEENEFPWGTWAYKGSLDALKHMDLEKKLDEIIAKNKSATMNFPGFLIPISILLFECAPDFAEKFAMRLPNCVPTLPRLRLYRPNTTKRISTEQVQVAEESIKRVQSILLPDDLEKTTDWVRSLDPVQDSHPHVELDGFVKSLERKLVLFPVSLKRKSCEVKSPKEEKKPPKKMKLLSMKKEEVVVEEKRKKKKRHSPPQTPIASPQPTAHVEEQRKKKKHSPKTPAASPKPPSNEDSIKMYIEQKFKELEDLSEKRLNSFKEHYDKKFLELEKRSEERHKKLEELLVKVCLNSIAR